MTRVEEAIKGLAPILTVREMIEPLQRDMAKIAHSVNELTESDLELKQMHKALMVERAQQEEERHRLELKALNERVQAEREEREAERLKHEEDRKRRGPLAFVNRLSPFMQFLLTVAAVAGVIYGLVTWLQQHVK